MTHLLCSDRSVNIGMNLDKKILQAKYSREGLFLFSPPSIHIKKVVTLRGQNMPLGIPLSVTIKKKSESLWEPEPYFTLLSSLGTGASAGRERHQIVTHTPQSKKYFSKNS